MRNAAGLNGQILQVVPVNAKVEVKSVSGSWTNVSYNGKTGWISNAYLK
jgi:uncharacterized protein YgiM (DUF1202 family)